jgi:hypothetical protein
LKAATGEDGFKDFHSESVIMGALFTYFVVWNDGITMYPDELNKPIRKIKFS